jgi:hypothetical protein
LRFVRFLLTYQRIIFGDCHLKHLIVVFFVSFSLLQVSVAGNPSPATNLHVKYSAEIKQQRVKAGSTIDLLIKLQPEKGIHINLEPPLSLALDSSTTTTVKGKLSIPAANKFLDASKPLKQSIVLSSSVKPGKQTIKGILTYYYCSDAEGWCSKFKQPVELTLNVVK